MGDPGWVFQTKGASRPMLAGQRYGGTAVAVGRRAGSVDWARWKMLGPSSLASRVRSVSQRAPTIARGSKLGEDWCQPCVEFLSSWKLKRA